MVQVAGSRLAGEQEYAFKHALIRDVAYWTLPKSVRARKHAEVGAFIADRAGDRSEGVVAMVADHSGAPPRWAPAPTSSPASCEEIDARALEALEAAGDARRRSTRTARRSSHYEAALALGGRSTPRRRPGSARSSATSRCGSAASTARSPSGSECMEYHRGEEELERVGDLHRKIGAGLWHKGDRGRVDRALPARDRPAQGRSPLRSSSSGSTRRRRRCTCTPATTCSRSTLRRRRCGSPSGSSEAAAASRAHGIFGRVFGRIGDYERARENLERSVELARDADPAEAVRALLALGYHLEVSEADYAGAGDRLRRRRSSSVSRPATCRRGSSFMRRSPGSPSTAATGSRSSARRTRRRASPSARGSAASFASPTPCAASSAGTAATSTAPSSGLERAFELAERSAAPRSPSSRSTGSRPRYATVATTPTPTRPSPVRSTSASAPGSSRSRSRRPQRAPSTSPCGGRASVRARSPPTRRASPSASATRSGARPASRPGAPRRRPPTSADACWTKPARHGRS